MTVTTRFAPSPTGYLHIGGARTALFSWLYARKLGGRFILRVEDTDRERSTGESVQAILDGMEWLGLSYDEGPFFQTERLKHYRDAVRQLLDRGSAYYCHCSREKLDAMRAAQMARGEKPRYDGSCRDREGSPAAGSHPVVRFRNPRSGQVVFDDLVYGRIVVANAELDDLIIARPDGTPTYNFCVVVDDADMAITHVIRGEDHISNTPRQINIMRAIGAPVPQYAHLPMILGADGQRLSKRHGAVSVMQYRDSGYLPQALLTYLARFGWSHGDRELFSREQLINLFDLRAVRRSAGMFDVAKLNWVNRHYLQANEDGISENCLAQQLQARGINPQGGPPLQQLIEVLGERVHTLGEMADQSRYFFVIPAGYDEKAAARHLRPDALPVLQALHGALSTVDDWSRATIQQTLNAVIASLQSKIGKVGPPLRVAVTGNTASPPLDVTLALLGKARTLPRIEQAMAFIQRTDQQPH